MSSSLGIIFKNTPFFLTILSWLVAQGIKITLGLLREKRFNFFWLLRTGGMPSAHSAAVVALAFSIGKETGFYSPLFALASIFALITMFDAQTWRRSIGAQARILNRIMEDIHQKKRIEEEQLRELVGHTPVEVFVGALIGIVIPLIFYK